MSCASVDIKIGDKLTFGWLPGRLFWLAPGRRIVPYPQKPLLKIVRVP